MVLRFNFEICSFVKKPAGFYNFLNSPTLPLPAGFVSATPYPAAFSVRWIFIFDAFSI